MTKDEALCFALETMNLANSSYDKMLLSDPPQSAWRYHNVDMKLREAITAIEAVLEAKDESWEKFCDSNCVWTDHHPDCKLAQIEQPKVRTGNCLRVGVCASEGHKIQPQRIWVGLTDEEMKAVCAQTWSYDPYLIARAIEAKLKEKNT
jgi:hypothetical protein